MFDPEFLEDFLAGDISLLELGKQMNPITMLSHKHLDLKSLKTKEAVMPELNKSSNEDIKYVHMELMKVDATRTDEPKAGLFRGIKHRAEGAGENRKETKFIILGDQSKPSDVQSYHLDRFNIMSITLKYADTTELVVFKADSFDQKQALDVVGAVVEELRSAGWMVDNDPEIVDITKYKEVPTDVGGSTAKPTAVKPVSGVGSGSDPYSGIYSGRCAFNNETWREQQEARKKREEMEKKMRWTPTRIAREGELPELKMLNLMKKKITQIASGDYEYELPEVKDDDGDEDTSGTTSVINDCKTCMHSTSYGYKDTSKAVCQGCKDHDKYDDGEDYAGMGMGAFC